MVFFYKMDQRIVKVGKQLDSVEVNEERLNEAISEYQSIEQEWCSVLDNFKDPRKQTKISPKQLLNILNTLLDSPLLNEE